jgi:hypothetical protein
MNLTLDLPIGDPTYQPVRCLVLYQDSLDQRLLAEHPVLQGMAGAVLGPAGRPAPPPAPCWPAPRPRPAGWDGPARCWPRKTG